MQMPATWYFGGGVFFGEPLRYNVEKTTRVGKITPYRQGQEVGCDSMGLSNGSGIQVHDVFPIGSLGTCTRRTRVVSEVMIVLTSGERHD